MLAYLNDHALKSATLAEMAAHREADELVQGRYWDNGKGCAVGCLSHDPKGGHAALAKRLGIPLPLLHLEDAIFERLPLAKARLWPEQFLGAIAPGADLSRVSWQFLYWLLTDATVNPGIMHPLVRDAVAQCAAVIDPLTRGETFDASAAWSAASAESAVWSAARSAESAAYELMAVKLLALLVKA